PRRGAVRSRTGKPSARPANNQSVCSECLLIEEKSGFQSFIYVAVEALCFERRRIDPQLREQPARFLAVRKGRLNGDGSAICEQRSPANLKLIAFGMAAEVVVVIEDENRAGRIALAIKIRCREPADSGAHDHYVKL